MHCRDRANQRLPGAEFWHHTDESRRMTLKMNYVLPQESFSDLRREGVKGCTWAHLVDGKTERADSQVRQLSNSCTSFQ